MCKIMEDLNRLAIEEIVLNLLRKNMSVENISEVLNLSEEKVREIQQKVMAEA